MLSTDSISNKQSSMTSFSGSLYERPRSPGISMVETSLRVTELCFLEACISSTSFEGQSEFRRMQRAKSLASVLQIGTIDSSEDVVEKTQHQPAHDSISNKTIRPTPLDFVHFLPWLCVEWQSPQFVHVTCVVQEEYVSVLPDLRKSKASRASSKAKIKRKEVRKIIEDSSASFSKVSQSSLVDVPLFITATFDTNSHLVEIAITDRNMDIHRKTLQAISVCIPFHCLLTRLTLQWAKLDNILIYEIAKFLPNSNLTDIILDDTLGRPNYDLLLSKVSPLKYLSLNRCLIDDDQCKKIAANIDLGTGGVDLKVLDLGSNLITDVGALAIAESLRRNRSLLHLNLSGNMVTDAGAVPLLSHLMKFRLRLDEIMETKRRKTQYLQKKMRAFESCHREVVIRRERDENQKKKSRFQKSDFKGNNKLRTRATTSYNDGKDNDYDDAAKLTLQRVGNFFDIFDERSTITENEWTYCTGNMVLCSLNLAYNNLTYFSIQKIREVLKYQNEMMISEGLKRVIFCGNGLPVDCELYSEITNYLMSSLTVDEHKKRPTKEKSLKTTKLSKIKIA